MLSGINKTAERQLKTLARVGLLETAMKTGEHTDKVLGYFEEARHAMTEYVKFIGDPIDPTKTKGNIV